jgi:cytochrome P450
MPEIPMLSFRSQLDGSPSPDLAYNRDVPVCPMRLPATGEEVLVLRTRETVVAALSSRNFSVQAVDQDRYATTGSAFRSDQDLLRLDPPETTSFRRPLGASLSETRIDRWRPQLTRDAGRLAADLTLGYAVIDLTTDYNEPFIARAVTSTLGVPKEEWPYLQWLSDTTLGSVNSMEDKEGITAAWEESYDYCRSLADVKRAEPDGSIFADMVASLDAAGKSREAVVHAAATLLVGFPSPLPVELLQRPEAVAACIENPALWGPTVKELLRYKAHFAAAIPRIALRDVQIGDVHISKGQVVLPSFTAAALDPEKTAHPHEFDIEQEASRNIAFGTGAHLCPGAALSRQWLEVGLQELFTAYPKLKLGVPADTIRWISGGLSVPEALLVRL